MFKARKYKELEKKLGYRFKNEALLGRALTHASLRGAKKVTRRQRTPRVRRRPRAGARDRRAALGDLPDRDRRRTRPPSQSPRARRDLRQGRPSAWPRRIPDAVRKRGGKRRAAQGTILADAVEAVLGAIFLEAGFNKARDTVRRLWENEEVSFGQAAADPKSALQEWAQGQGLALPMYVEVERTGPDHAPRFTSEVHIKGRLRRAAKARRNDPQSRPPQWRCSSAKVSGRNAKLADAKKASRAKAKTAAAA